MAFTFTVLSAADEQQVLTTISTTTVNNGGGVSPFTAGCTITFTGNTSIARTGSGDDTRYNLLLEVRLNGGRTENVWASSFLSTRLDEVLGSVSAADLAQNSLNRTLLDAGWGNMTLPQARQYITQPNCPIGAGRTYRAVRLTTRDGLPMATNGANGFRFFSYKLGRYLAGNLLSWEAVQQQQG